MILEDIVKAKRKKLKKLTSKKYSLIDKLKNDSLSVIAEIKKASPSKGVMSKNFEPEKLLYQYQKGGASALSILTETQYFQGNIEILKQIRKKTELPILRKDFIIDPIQIYQSKLIEADVILLIARILTESQLKNFLTTASSIGLEAIVEVHNLKELKKVIATPASIIGINNRNLEDFSVNLNTTPQLINYLKKKDLREKFYIVSESGIKSGEDIKFLKQSGIDGILVGEALVKADKPSQKIKEFIESY